MSDSIVEKHEIDFRFSIEDELPQEELDEMGNPYET